MYPNLADLWRMSVRWLCIGSVKEEVVNPLVSYCNMLSHLRGPSQVSSVQYSLQESIGLSPTPSGK